MSLFRDASGSVILDASGAAMYDATGPPLEPAAPEPAPPRVISDPLFGQDIALGEDWQALVAADGSLVLTQGVQTGLQDIRLRLFTRLGTLFYDPWFGALIVDWIKEENTVSNRLAFEAEVVRRIHADPRVVTGSASCRVVVWDATGIRADVSFEFINADHAYNLVITTDGLKLDMVLADIDPA